MTGALLRIFMREGDRFGNQALHEAVIGALRAAGVDGATVLKGIEGFGIRGKVRSARSVDFAGDLPLVIEVIESDAKLEAVLPALSGMIAGGLMTVERVEYLPVRKAAQP